MILISHAENVASITIALCLMLWHVYYAQNYAGMIGTILCNFNEHHKYIMRYCKQKRLLLGDVHMPLF